MMFTVPLKLPSKKNSYRIRKAGRRIWISPSQEVVDAENTISMFARRHLREFTGPVMVKVGIYGRLDVDNALGVIFDGLKKSGRIGDDRNIVEAVIVRMKGKNDKFHIEVMDWYRKV